MFRTDPNTPERKQEPRGASKQCEDKPRFCFQIVSSDVARFSFSPGVCQPAARKVLRLALNRVTASRVLGISESTLWRYSRNGLIHPVLALKKPIYTLKEIRRFAQAMGIKLEMEFEEPKPGSFAITQVEVAEWLDLSLSSVARLVHRDLIKKNPLRKLTQASVEEFLETATT